MIYRNVRTINFILNIAFSVLLSILSLQFQSSYRHVIDLKKTTKHNFAISTKEKSLNNN